MGHRKVKIILCSLTINLHLIVVCLTDSEVVTSYLSMDSLPMGWGQFGIPHPWIGPSG